MKTEVQAPRTTMERLTHWRETCEALGDAKAREIVREAIEEVEQIYDELVTVTGDAITAYGKRDRSRDWARAWKAEAKMQREGRMVLLRNTETVGNLLDDVRGMI